MKQRGPGFAVLYRWRLHEGKEQQFIQAWSRVSERLLAERGSLGSRLHRGADGWWYSYAQWPSAEAREQAFAQASVDPGATRQMREAVAESLPELVLEAISDYMVLPPKNGTSQETPSK
ncbi:antibiotic biosynthesis monooxygenase family protein [Methylibium rhizosphaerae]|uniref:antibiotic biosynthesis monooxygenase family protein n=1 Tax=Methylibium rhizosphaerae TaxID=2570323 RepID=UPI00112A4CE4|nr:antibiotic biosynthesis monooxygenase [Methylibium rhizosphaerae]